jgi:serine/threonine protein kinase
MELGFQDSLAKQRPLKSNPTLTFGDYELIEQIGRGGMGVVYKARQRSLNRVVALKMVLDSHLASPVVLRRFLIEAEAAAKLEHPHIVPIYEIGEIDGQHFFSMRLIEGEGLEEKIALGEFELPPGGESRFKTAHDKMQARVATLMATVARAVHYAHERGVLHRDLKPNNILIDKNNQPHLTDFGLAKVADSQISLTPKTAVLGTPGYMPPEQALGGECTQGADIYSLGAIFYELLTGKPPFEGPTPLETLRRTREEEPLHPATVNRAVDRDLGMICLKCLEKEPMRRYGTAEELAADLERWLRHEPIRAKHAGPMLRTQRWIRRNPVGTALIATLLIGLSAALMLLKMVVDARDAAEQRRKLLLVDLDMKSFWGSPSPSLLWSSEKLRSIMDRSPRAALSAGGGRYRVGILVEENPVNRVIGYAPFLAYLEEKLDSRSHRLDLVTYKRNQDAIDDFVKGELDFLRIGGLSYLEAHGKSPGVVPLLSQGPAKTGLIFVRADSPIRNLSDLKGRSFAFGDSYATISFWARYCLANAGIGADELKEYKVFDSLDAFEKGVKKGRIDLGPGENLNSHTEAMKAVIAGKYDASVGSAKQFRQALDKHQVRVLTNFPSTSLFWLAGGDLPQKLVQNIRRAMLEITDKALLEGIGGQNTRFNPVSEKEIEELARATEVVAKGFPTLSANEVKSEKGRR